MHNQRQLLVVNTQKLDDESTAGRRLFNRHTWCARHLT